MIHSMKKSRGEEGGKIFTHTHICVCIYSHLTKSAYQSSAKESVKKDTIMLNMIKYIIVNCDNFRNLFTTDFYISYIYFYISFASFLVFQNYTIYKILKKKK